MAGKDMILDKVDKLEVKYEERKEEDRTSLKKLTHINEPSEDTIGNDSAMEKGIDLLFTEDNIGMKTELSAPLILAMSRGRIFQKHFHSKVMKNFIDNIQVLSISKGRKGRQELVTLLKNSQEYGEMEDNNMGGIAKLLGK